MAACSPTIKNLENTVKIADCNWMQVEDYLKRDDRAVVPLGSIEQHGYLSLATDAILAERVAVEAAEPLGVPVFPAIAYGITPYFQAYPGTISLRVSTYVVLVRDILDSLKQQGFKRIVLVNGHGGNSPASSLAGEWLADSPQCTVAVHNWWNAPRTWNAVQNVDPVASHASWMENFPWNRVTSVPSGAKPMTDLDALRRLAPAALRDTIQDGNYGGAYAKDDDLMLAIWRTAVEETRELIDGI